MKRKLFKRMWLAMLLVAFAGYGTEQNAVLPQMDLPKAEVHRRGGRQVAIPVVEA